MSDSESDAGDSITSTSVLLGYAEKEPTDDPISQLGGQPKWLHPNSPADSRLAKCQNCNRLMSMLLQLNGDIPETPHERVFYVWACKRKTCWRKKGTVRAFRGVKCAARPEPSIKKAEPQKEEIKEEKKKDTINAGDFLFGGGGTGKSTSGANPFSSSAAASNPFSSNNPSTSNNPFATAPPPPEPKPETKTETMTRSFAETLKIGVPPPQTTKEESLFYGPAEPWPDPLPHMYPSYHLDAEYEQLDTRAPELPSNVQVVDNDEYADTPMSNTDASESISDKTFQKFADRVSQNPEQVLRYERLGTPLLYSKDDEVGKLLLDNKGDFATRKIPPCGNCRKPGSRVFEFQLMPYAITMLERDEMGLDGMEWGTIVVATCVCVPAVLDANGVGYVEEWVGVQWESLKMK